MTTSLHYAKPGLMKRSGEVPRVREVRREVRGARRALVLATAFAGTVGARDARAQTSTTSTAKVAAETLFEDARHLMADGKAGEACPKFAESQRLDPSPSTLLNLASCYEKTDRPATAWVTYREGASAASAAGRQELVATAQRHADALFPTLARLTLNVVGPVDGMSVALDGVAVGRAEWTVAVPVDPGEHTVEASAPHFKAWSTKLTVSGGKAATTTVTVPALEAAPPEALPAAGPTSATQAASSPGGSPAGAGTQPPPSDAPPSTPSTAGSTLRAAGLVLGGVGVVGLGVAGAFAIGAKSAYNSSLAECRTGAPNECSQAGVNQRNSALDSGNVATVAVVVGATALAAGVVLWLVAPSKHTAQTGPTGQSAPGVSLALLPTLGGGMLRGTW
jgi:hypothetical protein